DRSAGIKTTGTKGNIMNAFKNVGYNLLGSMGLGFIPQAINDVKGNYSMVKSGNKSMMGGIFDSAMSIGDYLGLSPITGLIRDFMGDSNRYSTGKNDPLGYAYGGLSALKNNFMGSIDPKYSQIADLGMNTVDRYMSNRQQNAFVVQPNRFNQSQLDRMTLDAKKDAINKMVQSPQLASDPGLKDAITNSIGNLDTMREGQANDMIKILAQLLESQVQTNQAIVGMLGNNNNSVQTGSGNNTVIVGQKNGMPNPMNTSMADNTLALLEKVKRIASQR
ncbi:MAG: hypothetical protein ACRCXX_11435, partial [Cetobacterium sp.]|uniref:hypothetical protein n=1 Tax=Cetobacterium sp. TaxID=2071632 RepID=UPI003F3F6BCA